jgi:hypothetical protein
MESKEETNFEKLLRSEMFHRTVSYSAWRGEINSAHSIEVRSLDGI